MTPRRESMSRRARLEGTALRVVVPIRLAVAALGCIAIVDDAGPALGRGDLPSCLAVLVAAGTATALAVLAWGRLRRAWWPRVFLAHVVLDTVAMLVVATVLDPSATSAAWVLVLVPVGEAAALLGATAAMAVWGASLVTIGAVAIASQQAGLRTEISHVAVIALLGLGPVAVLVLQAHLLRGALGQAWRTGTTLHRDATTDELTELLNRRGLRHTVGIRPAFADGYGVLFCDLDHFKAVNDEQGHEAGDAVLRTVARRLESAVREDDLVARLAGDEFAVLVPSHDEHLMETVAKRILQVVTEPIVARGVELRIGASVGWANARDADDLDRGLDQADAAMYLAKGRREHPDPVASSPGSRRGGRRDRRR